MNFKEFKKVQAQERVHKEFLKKTKELQNKLQTLHSVMRFKWLVENTETALDEKTCIIEPRYDDCMFYGTINILRKGFDNLGKTWFYLSFNTSREDPLKHTFSFTEYSEKGIPIYNITVMGFQELRNYFGDESPFKAPEDIKDFEDYLMHLYKERKDKKEIDKPKKVETFNKNTKFDNKFEDIIGKLFESLKEYVHVNHYTVHKSNGKTKYSWVTYYTESNETCPQIRFIMGDNGDFTITSDEQVFENLTLESDCIKALNDASQELKSYTEQT